MLHSPKFLFPRQKYVAPSFDLLLSYMVENDSLPLYLQWIFKLEHGVLYLRYFETEFVNNLGYESGSRWGRGMENTRGRNYF